MPAHARPRRRAALAAACSFALAAPLLAAATPAGATAPDPRVDWGACDDDILATVPDGERDRYSCADHEVPLDHADPEGERISIALLRRAADDPDARIGSAFVNPGGPGNAGRVLAVNAANHLDEEVLDSFDIVGFDPRGTGASTPFSCFTSDEEAAGVFGRLIRTPVNEEEVSGSLAGYRSYAEHCAANAGPLIEHMSTRDVAHDLDALRAAVGEERITYVGQSYGTLIGATYANLYPERVRAMVFDASVDPDLRTNDGLEQDRQRAGAHEEALDAFLTACAEAGDACAFGSGDPHAKWDALRERLHQGPIDVPGGAPLTADGLITGVAYGLFSQAGLGQLAAQLQGAHDAMTGATTEGAADPRALLTAEAPLGAAGPDAEPSPHLFSDPHFAFNCSDKPFDHAQGDVPALVEEWEAEMPTFSRFQLFGEAALCPLWPAASPDPYTGPWELSTEIPVLVLGGVHDPATPYAFSERVVEQLGAARLVTVDGFGHCFTGLSEAGDALVSDYLLDLRVPEEGTVVELDAPPFS
ncbi:alpha/beta hydrolase [Streptomyces sedi]|uniref:Alpha/beta hydrolase n=1 Tax=Streptomyces sedi TaxID=555059 RepID=A0A5C4VE90_9ACTN|nr:alpha/beta hydrolase [Streptomyces sedi]TNM34203.1 alpha/beta hydrolase [Streptomyces sedi]